MSTTLTETAANADFTTGLLVPQGGVDSFANAATIIEENSLQQLADRTQALKNLSGAGGDINVRLPLAAGSDNANSADWVFGTNGNGTGSTGGLSWGQADVGLAPQLYFPFSAPPGRTIKSFRSRVRGNLGNLSTTIHSSLPATMPITALIRSKYDGSALEVIDTITDPSPSVAVYDEEHDMVKVLSSPHTVSPDYSYYVRVVGETGANSVAFALGVFLVEVTFGVA